MKNIDIVRQLFLRGDIIKTSNSQIGKITGIQPHQQVYQLTNTLLKEGFLQCSEHGREKIFYLNDTNSSKINADLITSQSDDHSKTTDNSHVSTKEYKMLIDVGFENVGHWKLINDNIDFQISKCGKCKKVLYAFTSANQVLYIGKTIRTLNQRLGNYKNPGPSQPTNTKNNQNISDLLKQGKNVEILVFAPGNPISYRGIPINLAAGLEDNLIEIIKPPWNATGKS